MHIHGFLTVGGEKMSKSLGTFIMASTYLKHLDPTYLRYYYASKLGPRLDDIDMNLDELVAKVNSDLVGKVVNIASRSAKFVAETGLSTTYPDDGGLFAAAAARADTIAELYERCDYNNAMREVMLLADAANKYVDEKAPWTMRKDPSKAAEVRDVCTVALNLFRQLMIYLAPVLPRLAEQTGELLNSPIQSWDAVQQPLMGSSVSAFKHMLQRITPEQVQAMTEESKVPDETAAPAAPQWNDGPDALAAEPLTAECTIDDFVKVDLRVARIISAEDVPEANKLLKLKLSLGGDSQRQVFAGIKAAYKPEDLIGKLVIVVANLKPRQMKFGLSEGMICASGPGGKDVFLLAPDSGAVPGQRVH